MEIVVRASVTKARLFAWFGMNVGLEVAAVILWVILSLKGVGAHHDPTLMALQIDMAGISHDKEVLGLCNAVDLND